MHMHRGAYLSLCTGFAGLFFFLALQPPKQQSVFDLECGRDSYFFSEPDLYGHFFPLEKRPGNVPGL